ncbi:sugar ABC transporter ATP-binding protein [Sporanaerobium hydrogeniformans]|uniref:Sugar ABC transporter ATP-binding protein n=1 Tax=Sporanaerobium hydrogeniformans TaxID=3072179 RepID=A0AC61DG19_9FIRM|nr:carbohydrate ABC transporter permease [Sporanaerobium hydrogeniformans]PHV71840.1 sugar ABC transporter ATP-binding protein [Sporanaerobium hydrogeniformans]
MKTKLKISKQNVTKAILTLIMLVLAIIVVFPFMWMIVCSFKPLNELYEFPPRFISPNMSLDNYKEVLFGQNPSFLVYFKNTFITTIVCVIGTVFTSSMAGYAFAKLQFKGRDQLFLLYLVTMMVPFQVLMVPQFIQFKYMGIFNTLWALILPRLFTPLGTFLMRQFFLDVPTEIIEAGRVDGLGEFGIFYKLILPLAKPAVSTVVILNFVWRWNEYEAPLIFLTDSKLFTLTVGLTNFIDEAGFAMDHLIMAGTTIALIPMVVVFILGQKYFIEGLTSGSVKG